MNKTIVRTTLRYPKTYHDYYGDLAHATGIDVAVLHRLALHIAPFTKQFQDMVLLSRVRHREVDRRPRWTMDAMSWLSANEEKGK